MAGAQFPEPKSLNILEIGDGVDYAPGDYSLANPHPGYGKDPNIKNQLGHTEYPKLVYPNGKHVEPGTTNHTGVLVHNKSEEDEVMGTKKKDVADWGKK